MRVEDEAGRCENSGTSVCASDAERVQPSATTSTATPPTTTRQTLLWSADVATCSTTEGSKNSAASPDATSPAPWPPAGVRPYYYDKQTCIVLGDCREVLPTLADNSVDMVATDPPYFRVKQDAWDRQWKDSASFIAWIGELCVEWERLLKPNGSLYVFASPQMAARVEVEIARRMNVLNSIVWNKPGKSWAAVYGEERFRNFVAMSERVIFAEHYGADNIAKGEAGYAAKCDELRGFVFEPLRAYLDEERKRAGIDKADINAACGFSRCAGGMASRHYFSRSQWCLPTAEHYAAMRVLFNASGGEYLRREYEDLRREYEDLRREYEDLRREYEDLRRPFFASAEVPYTDVWTFPPVSNHADKHPCEKPLDMMRHIVTVSSRPDALVLDCFAGSGSTLVAAQQEGRRAIGIEIEERYCEIAAKRLSQEVMSFAPGENHEPSEQTALPLGAED